MSRALVERKLTQVAARLKEARAELEVVDEQLAFFADAADDMRLRALVSEKVKPKGSSGLRKEGFEATRARTNVAS